MKEKLEMSTKDISQENIKKIRELFPNCVTETEKDGKVVLGVDFDALKQELSSVVINDKKERYQMTWPDKSKAKLLANSKINATLRPVKEKSVNFDTTENLYIEGDNLDVLKLLRETYLGKVKMIYIDPPYNTGKDFIYKDNFSKSTDEFLNESEQYDIEGNRLVQNTETNGRFHTDWLNIIYSRIKVAYDLLHDDGVLFISIDDNECANIIKVCIEIFGESSYLSLIPRLTSAQRPSQEKYISIQHDYILVLIKNKNRNLSFNRTIRRDGLENVKKDNIGLYFEGDTSPILASATQGYSAGGDYDFEYNGIIYKPIANDGTRRRWLWTKPRMEAAARLGILVQTKNGLRVQNYINKEFQLKTNIMVEKDMNLIFASYDFMNAKFANKNGTAILSNYKIDFDFAKPVELIYELIKLIPDKNAIILDFFSGSATTAHAVMKLNAEDGGNRKFIMVQLQEECSEKSEAYKAGYKTICDIGEERIRRAGKQIYDELKEKQAKAGLLDEIVNPDSLDIGFRVLKLDSSNMNDVYYNPSHMNQLLLDESVDNIKSDRTDLDLLFQVMLELGIELSAKIEEVNINNVKYYKVNDNDIIACFDNNLSNDTLIKIAQQEPLYAVFKDSAFSTDSLSINNEQIFKTHSPSTKIRVL